MVQRSRDGHSSLGGTRTAIVLRPVGSGLPVGFFSFGIGMLILGCQAIGWIPASEQHEGGMVLMSFVFPLEFTATIFAFLARDTLGATTLGLFTTSWLALGWSELASPPGKTSTTLAVYLLGFAFVVLLLSYLSTRGKPFFALLLLLASARMALSAIHELGGGTAVYRISGGIGIALAAVAFYGGVALGLEDAQQREVLPLFRRGAAAESFEGLEQQLARLEAEPGVRQQL